MSAVTKADCIACNPQSGDLNGIRRPIAGGVTSEEIFNLVNHILNTHTSGISKALLAAEAADDTARLAIKIANDVTQRLDSKVPASSVPRTAAGVTEYRSSQTAQAEPELLPAIKLA